MKILLRILAIVISSGSLTFGQSFEPGKVYYGLLKHHVVIVEFTVDEASEGLCSGTLRDQRSGRPGGAPIPFLLKKTSNETWKLSWHKQDSEAESINELRLIETTHGPALAGNQLKPDSNNLSLNSYDLGVIWLDPTLETHPIVYPNWELPILSATDGYDITRYTSEDGLAGNATRCLTQTQDGFIWIGTVDGLSRFDGFSWDTFGPRSDPPLPDEVTTWLGTNPQGGLVVGTKTAGLFFQLGSRFPGGIGIWPVQIDTPWAYDPMGR